jgi:hypothetical protein
MSGEPEVPDFRWEFVRYHRPKRIRASFYTLHTVSHVGIQLPFPVGECRAMLATDGEVGPAGSAFYPLEQVLCKMHESAPGLPQSD